jgi:haloalkane dehalogenase
MSVAVLRTPQECFRDLPDYPFAPNYLAVAPGLRMHYVDEGPRDAPAVVMLHGEPTWSYLYRTMIPRFVAAGLRAVAPDLIGFGKSDKPTDPAAYSYAGHVAWVRQLLEPLALRDATLVAQDWGSLIGLRLAAEAPALFARIAIANGFLPSGQLPLPRAFRLWRAFARYSPVLPCGRIVASACVRPLPRAVRAAYDAPFPTRAYQVGARRFPLLVPERDDDPAMPANRAAWDALGAWQKPFLTLFGKNDPVLGGADAPLIAHIPGARGQPHERLWGGHFVQEDRGDYLAAAIARWIQANPG